VSPTLNNNNNMMLTAENIPRGADEDDAFGVGWAVHGQLTGYLLGFPATLFLSTVLRALRG
jgi:hypothetical protein